jgi:Flp pilus assembly protein TadD
MNPCLSARLWLVLLAALLAGCAALPGLPTRGGAELPAATVAEPAAAAPAGARERQTYLAVIARLREGGQHYAAYAHLLALEARYGGGADVTALKADALRASGDAPAAAALYAQLLDTPLAGKGYHGLGLLAGARQDYAAAAQLLERAAARDSTAAELQSDLGYALLRGGRVAEARRPLMTASELAPQDPRIQANLALYRSLEPAAPIEPATVAAGPPAPRAFAAAEALRLALGPASAARRAGPAPAVAPSPAAGLAVPPAERPAEGPARPTAVVAPATPPTFDLP